MGKKGPTISVILRYRYVRGNIRYQQPQSIQSMGSVKKKIPFVRFGVPPPLDHPLPPGIDGAENNDRIKTDRTRKDIGRSLETYPVNPVVRMAYNVISMVYMVSYTDVVKGNIILLYSIDAHNF